MGKHRAPRRRAPRVVAIGAVALAGAGVFATTLADGSPELTPWASAAPTTSTTPDPTASRAVDHRVVPDRASRSEARREAPTSSAPDPGPAPTVAGGGGSAPGRSASGSASASRSATPSATATPTPTPSPSTSGSSSPTPSPSTSSSSSPSPTPTGTRSASPTPSPSDSAQSLVDALAGAVDGVLP